MPKTPHVHAAVIKAWADGAQIQYKTEISVDWKDFRNGHTPSWEPTYTYRVKPEPKPDTIIQRLIVLIGNEAVGTIPPAALGVDEHCNVYFTFDGETGKLKGVELIKDHE